MPGPCFSDEDVSNVEEMGVMQPFNWIDIDGIRYSWDGQGSITCAGQFGYQASIAGDRLDNVEIENSEGDIAGALCVDFAAASITYLPQMDVEPSHSVLIVGHEHGQQEYSIVTFHPPFLHDLLDLPDPLSWPVTADEPVPLSPSSGQGEVLSWDSFHFDDEDDLLASSLNDSAVPIANLPEPESTVTISLDLTNQVLEQIPPLHDV